MKLNHGLGGRGQRFSPQQQSWLLEVFERRQVPAAAFAARHGFGVSTLYRWRRRMPRRRRPKDTAPPAQALFQSIPLGQVLGTTGSWVGEVSRPDGTQLR